MTPYVRPPWTNWKIRMSVDLLRFISDDVPELRQFPYGPYSKYGLCTAENAARRLFPDGPESDLNLTSRWDRFVGWTFIQLLGVGEWIDAPAEMPGLRDADGLMPVVRLPDGKIIEPMLPLVLAEPESSPRRGAILIKAVEAERKSLERWYTSGKPRAR